MRVLYFAQAAEIAGCREEIWPVLRTLSASEFWSEAIERHPGLQGMETQCRLAVNQQFLESGNLISPHSEVAVLPPVSGG